MDLEIIIATSDQACLDYYTDFNPRVKVFWSIGGPAKKRNIATRYAKYDLLAFFDDDIEVLPSTVFEMYKFLINNPEVGMVFGKLLNMEFRDTFDEAGSYLTWSGFLWARAESGCKDTGQYEKVEMVLAGKSAACMIRRKLFCDVGMFDVSYEILAEETDLAWRVWLSGHKVFYVPSSVTYHAFNTRFKPQDFYIPRRVYFNGCRNYLAMLTTNLEAKNLVLPLLTQTCVWFMAACGMLITGKTEAGKYILEGLGWFFSHLGSILLKRKQVQAKRKVRDHELMPLILRNPPWSYYINRFFHYIRHGRHG